MIAPDVNPRRPPHRQPEGGAIAQLRTRPHDPVDALLATLIEDSIRKLDLEFLQSGAAAYVLLYFGLNHVAVIDAIMERKGRQ